VAAGTVFLLLRCNLSSDGVADVRYKSDLGLASQQWEKGVGLGADLGLESPSYDCVS
jgi:hypothetical protein